MEGGIGEELVVISPLILLLPPPSPEEKASMLKDYQNISTMG